MVFEKDIGALYSEGSCQSLQQCFLVFSLAKCNLSNWLFLSNLTMIRGSMKPNVKVSIIIVSILKIFDLFLSRREAINRNS